MSFHGWNNVPSEVHSCLFCAITIKIKRWSIYVSLELRRYSDLMSHHIKEPQNCIYCLNFLNDKIRKLWFCFTPKVSCPVLTSLLHNVLFHCVRTWCVSWDTSTLTKRGGILQRVSWERSSFQIIIVHLHKQLNALFVLLTLNNWSTLYAHKFSEMLLYVCYCICFFYVYYSDVWFIVVSLL